MCNEITIRKATHDDIKKIIEIEISAAKLFLTLPSSFLEQLPKNMPAHEYSFYYALISSETSWIICIDNLPVGFICSEYIQKENTLHIHEFDIAESFQHRGLGKKLLNFVIDTARQENISRLTLTTFKQVLWNASFYAANGFSTITHAALNNRLHEILIEEANSGFPIQTRCAMELLLTSL